MSFKFKIGDPIYVSAEAPFHSGRSGWFAFYGEGASEGTVVLSSSPPEEEKKGEHSYFAVSMHHALPIPTVNMMDRLSTHENE